MTRKEGAPISVLTEAEWQRQVYDLLDLYGWDYKYHVQRSKYSPWGWPDIVAVRRRDRRLLFAETKRQGGKATPDQLAVLELLLDVAGGEFRGTFRNIPAGLVHVDVELWEPGDVDRVMEVLK